MRSGVYGTGLMSVVDAVVVVVDRSCRGPRRAGPCGPCVGSSSPPTVPAAGRAGWAWRGAQDSVGFDCDRSHL